MLELEFVPPGPAVSEVLVGLCRASEPMPCALDFALGPEQARDDDDDNRVVARLLERVRRTGLALRSRLIPDGDGPKATRRRALLQTCEKRKERCEESDGE